MRGPDKGMTAFIVDLYEYTSTGRFERALDDVSAEQIAQFAVADGVGEDVVYYINQLLEEKYGKG